MLVLKHRPSKATAEQDFDIALSPASIRFEYFLTVRRTEKETSQPALARSLIVKTMRGWET